MSDDAGAEAEVDMASTQPAAKSPSKSGGSKPASPRKALAAAKALRSTGAFGLTEHQLMLADLFKTPKAVIPEGEPKNIEVLQQLAKPLPRHRTMKFTEELEQAKAEAKKAVKPHDLGEPSNLEFLLNLSKPTPRLRATKFDDELKAIAELKIKSKDKPELPEPSNIERLMEMAKPQRKTKKFEDLVAEEEAAAAKKGHVKFDPTAKRAYKPKKAAPKPKKPAAAAAPAAPKQEEEKTEEAQPAADSTPAAAPADESADGASATDTQAASGDASAAAATDDAPAPADS